MPFLQVDGISDALCENFPYIRRKQENNTWEIIMAAVNPTGFYILLAKNVPHILEKIFSYLDFESFKKCHEVCKAWSEILENPSYRRRSKALYQEEMVDKLFDATKTGNIKEITWLLSIGINSNVTKDIAEICFTTPLIEAVSTRWQNIGQRDDDNRSVELTNIDVVSVLLNAGADPNMTNNWGYSPLHFAAADGNTNAVKLLLDQGANPNQGNEDGRTALTIGLQHMDYYRSCKDTEMYNVIKDVMKMLIDGGTQVNEQDRIKMNQHGF